MRNLAPGTPIVLTRDHERGAAWGGPIPAGTKGVVAKQNNNGQYKIGRPHTLLTLFNVNVFVDGVLTLVNKKSYFVQDEGFRMFTEDSP